VQSERARTGLCVTTEKTIEYPEQKELRVRGEKQQRAWQKGAGQREKSWLMVTKKCIGGK